jgi:hypothetical protein
MDGAETLKEIPLSDFGLETVADAASRRGWTVRTVQNWIALGLIAAVRAGTGQRAVFLLRTADVDKFVPPLRGPRPPEKRKRKPKRKAA